MKKAMRISFAFAFAFALLAILLYFGRESAVLKIKKINGRPAILFVDNCKYNYFSLADENKNEIASVEYSNEPGEGAFFKNNTYIMLENILKTRIIPNRIYEFSAVTDCLPARAVPRKVINFSISKSGDVTIISID